MESDSSIEDYTVRVAQSWGVGQKDKSNGAVLFVFIQDRKMFMQVGYGLEGALPDALAKQIIENEIKPHFRNGDFEVAACGQVSRRSWQPQRGEYSWGHGADRGGNRVPRESIRGAGWVTGLVIAFIILIFLGRLLSQSSGGTVYSSAGRMVSYGLLGAFLGGGGSSSGSGGGGFSGVVFFRGGAVYSAVAGPGGVGEAMRTKHLFRELDPRLFRHHGPAIVEAEKQTTRGNPRVREPSEDSRPTSRRRPSVYESWASDKTKHRNAVLIFIAPESQNFAVLGDEAVHAKCGEASWESIAGAMREYFQQGKFTEGVVHRNQHGGQVARRTFPISTYGNVMQSQPNGCRSPETRDLRKRTHGFWLQTGHLYTWLHIAG